MSPEISVVVLCYRAGDMLYGFISRVIDMLDRQKLSWEMVLVGNYTPGTCDSTPDVVRDIASKNRNVKAVAMPKDGMMGWDAKTGLRETSGDYICIIDGDEQMPPEDILSVYKEIRQKGLDFVQTYRIRRHDGPARTIISFVYNKLFGLMFPRVKFRDVNSKPKIFTRDAYKRMELLHDDWFFDADMVLQTHKLKLRTTEIPTEFYRCQYRGSFIGIKAIVEFVKNLFFVKIRDCFDR